MRILVIGGTRFLGPYLAQTLTLQGHKLALANRGKAREERRDAGIVPEPPYGAVRITFDRRAVTRTMRTTALHFNPDTVIDMCCITGSDAEAMLELIAGTARRYVLVSSCDVYRAYGVLTGLEDGLEPTPLTEDSPLRRKLYPYRGDEPRALDDPQRILDNYDKIPAERDVLGHAQLKGTVLRLPMVYGPGDYQHRLRDYLGQMERGESDVRLPAGMADWRTCRGYVEDVAQAIALAATHPAAEGRVYNVAAEQSFSEREWVRRIGEAAGWQGGFATEPAGENGTGEGARMNFRQHLSVDSTRIRRELGYKELVPLEEGLARTIAWERALLEQPVA